jgi:hypothetical protein
MAVVAWRLAVPSTIETGILASPRSARWLDLDDVRAQVGEDHRRVWRCAVLAELNDGQAPSSGAEGYSHSTE